MMMVVGIVVLVKNAGHDLRMVGARVGDDQVDCDSHYFDQCLNLDVESGRFVFEGAPHVI